jgi:penicillin-binding protein 2
MRRVALNNTKKESTLFRARALVISIVVTVVFLLLLFRLYDLQITHNVHYQTLSNDNRVRVEAIPPMRGLIYDHGEVLLADNKPNYRLDITPSSVNDMDALLEALSDIISIQAHELRRFKKELRRKQSFQKIPLVYNLSDQEVAKFAVVQYYFPGVQISASSMRYYPQGKHFAHVMGYVGRINESDLVAFR